MRKKTILVLVLVSLVMCFSGVTYSLFHSDTSLAMENMDIAEFVFNANRTNHIELNFDDLVPGASKEFEFSVTNSSDNLITDVTTEYMISLRTFHFMPLTIELYKDDSLVMNCNEDYSRGSDNILVCNSDVWELGHNEEEHDNFKLRVVFSEVYNDLEYSDLVDFIDIDISSWQKVKEQGVL